MSVRMMRQSEVVPYVQERDVQVASLPYGEQPRFSMVVLLPRPGLALASLVDRLTPATWQGWMARLHPQAVDLGFPRFTYHYGAGLTPPLQALGMAAAFAHTANLSGMCTSACWLSDVRHTTFIHVDEKGTVATGVTTLEFGGGARPKAQVHMMVNRPFVLAILDGQTGSILFLGAVRAPVS